VGHKVEFKKIEFRSLKALHIKIEKDIDRYSNKIRIKLSPQVKVKLSTRYFKNIAQQTYESIKIIEYRISNGD